jgi:8-oxo-dGTP pyrophosphatase MutT (NUDIX family)
MRPFNDRGDRLVRLHHVDVIRDLSSYVPLTHAVALVRAPGGYVLVHNRSRGCWELPGGLAERAEAPSSCASRELLEETGIGAVRLSLRAVMELDLRPSPRNPTRRTEFGAVFAGSTTTVPSAFSSAEVAAITVREPCELPPLTCRLDAFLIRCLSDPSKDR